MEKTELSLEPYESHLQLFVWKEMLQIVTPREEQLLLRKDQTNLMVSGDQHSATYCYKMQQDYSGYRQSRILPPPLHTATHHYTTTQSTTTFAAQHYWEVYVGQHNDWEVGLPQVYLKHNGGSYQIYTAGSGKKSLGVKDNPQKIGIYLNCPRKELSFYNADNMKLIHTESCTVFPVSAHFHLGNSNNCHDPLMVCRY